jgi:hypothetical protein
MKYIFFIILSFFIILPLAEAGCGANYLNKTDYLFANQPILPIEPSKINDKNWKHFFYKKQSLPKQQKTEQLEDALFNSFVGVFFLGLTIFCIGFALNIVWLWWLGLALESFLIIMGLGLLFCSLIFSKGKGNFRYGQLLFYLSGWSGTIIWFFFKGLAALIFGLTMSISWLWIAGAVGLGLAVILGLIYIELVNLWV